MSYNDTSRQGKGPSREEKGMEESMTKEEMQRFLNEEAEQGHSKEEALDRLMRILGIRFPEVKQPSE